MIRCDTPESLIAKWDVMRPGIWRDMDTLQATKAVGELDWPDECAIPISASASVIQKSGTDIITAFRAAAEVTACYLWRKNRVIYQLDHTLAEALWAQANEMGEDEELPVDLLLHLPYPCIYVSTNIVDSFVGFFAWIEWDTNVHRYELRASWKFSSDGGTLAQMLHILPGQTLGQCVEDTMAQAMQTSNMCLQARCMSSQRRSQKRLLRSVYSRRRRYCTSTRWSRTSVDPVSGQTSKNATRAKFGRRQSRLLYTIWASGSAPPCAKLRPGRRRRHRPARGAVSAPTYGVGTGTTTGRGLNQIRRAGNSC